ncbi:hypothetical protein Ntsu_41170 [Nocardia sp. IFM 10818]
MRPGRTKLVLAGAAAAVGLSVVIGAFDDPEAPIPDAAAAASSAPAITGPSGGGATTSPSTALASGYIQCADGLCFRPQQPVVETRDGQRLAFVDLRVHKPKAGDSATFRLGVDSVLIGTDGRKYDNDLVYSTGSDKTRFKSVGQSENYTLAFSLPDGVDPYELTLKAGIGGHGATWSTARSNCDDLVEG